MRSALETKIQIEINQLNQVVSMQDGGKGPNHFDYELVKVVKDSEDQKKEEPQVETKEKDDAEEKPEPKEQPKQKAEESKEEEKEDEKD